MKAADEKHSNLMLFHGTSKIGAEGVLEEGFKNSESGWFGSGVYMSECSSTEFMYTQRNNNYYSQKGKINFIFVNEVFESEKLLTFEFDNIFDIENNNTPLKNSFNKHIRNFNGKKSPQITQEDYKQDVEGRLYRNVAVHKYSVYDEFVAEANVTIPRYLILIETEKFKE